MVELKENNENPNFRLKAIAELLDGNHHFYIPSYQRGYRWDKKQVDDLLKDIADFASNAKKGNFYCLQPIVVKSKIWKNKDGLEIIGWEVIDGQQRLTTLLLLLKYLRLTSEDAKDSKAQFYSIQYQTRPELDFDNLVKNNDIDSFHAYSAIKSIENWFIENTVKKSKMVEVLFDDYSVAQKTIPKNEWEPQVKVIWYVTENQKDIDSIKIFNNLNKGKIRLTNAELIKALFILKTQEYKNDKKVEELNIEELAYEWNEFESSLQDNRFWYFLANKEYNPATRIDLIFDFLTEKKEKDDDDFAYRRFQSLFDNSNEEFWISKHVTNFSEAWKKVKEVYQTFVFWFEDNSIYHYVGYLIYNGISINEIYTSCKKLSKSNTVSKLQSIIRDKILTYDKNDIDSFYFSHSDRGDYENIYKTLLFFNIETCVKQQHKQNKKIDNSDLVIYNKFPFDLFKLNNWDIEHVNSETTKPFKDIKDKIIWLSHISYLELNEDIKAKAMELLKVLKEKNKDEKKEFETIYTSVIEIMQPNDDDNKFTIDNLALLDAGTNRGYGNALFPSKRQIIIKNDTNGVFIPVCTKNLFLKYYSSDEKGKSLLSWDDNDRKAYIDEMHKTIDYILK
jgi:uncharacterized protein with ParB-like and HNH nuclease domain